MRLLIIQARLGSTRLQGKVLLPIEGKPLLQRIVERLGNSDIVDQIIIATSNKEIDTPIEDFARNLNVMCYRGSENDVLDRYYRAAQSVQSSANDTIIRVCADNPLHHSDVMDFVLNQFEQGDYDYFSNSNYEPDFLEDGFDVEVFRYWLLEKTWREATLPSDREHVCPYMKNPTQYKCGWKKYRKEYQFKLSVDTSEDLEAVRTIYKALLPVNPNFGIDDVLNLLNIKPEILAINKDSIINAGYHKSIEEQKK
tara:strand:- start:11993 stop:12754 length:762 start_codon:yes stop_codon:yes gene_type:complete